MAEHDPKTLEKLLKAVEAVYESPKKVFWRGFLLGLGKSLGSLIGWIILLALIFWVIQATGVADAMKQIFESFSIITEQFQNIRGFGR